MSHLVRTFVLVTAPVIQLCLLAGCSPSLPQQTNKQVPSSGAWVLWVREERLSDPMGTEWRTQTSSWNLLGSFSSEPECRRDLRDTVERVTHPNEASADADLMAKVEGDTVTILYFPKHAKPTDTVTRSQILHYVCLPVTLDPRERSR